MVRIHQIDDENSTQPALFIGHVTTIELDEHSARVLVQIMRHCSDQFELAERLLTALGQRRTVLYQQI